MYLTNEFNFNATIKSYCKMCLESWKFLCYFKSTTLNCFV